MKIEDNSAIENSSTGKMFEALSSETQALKGDCYGNHVDVFFDISDGEVFGVFLLGNDWCTSNNENVEYLCTIREAMTAKEVEAYCVHALQEKMEREFGVNFS